MRNSLSIATRGRLSKNVKKSLIIATFGLIAVSTTVTVPSGGGNWNHTISHNKINYERERLREVIEDDQEVVLIIKIFTQCQ